MVYGEPPLAWFWMNLGSTTLGWTAASYLSYFFIYMLISVVEFGTWCAYISGDPWLFGHWARISSWGSLILYFLPPLFALLNLVLPASSGGISSSTDAGYINAVMLTCIGFINWLFQWIVHFTFVDRLSDHVQAKDIVNLRAFCTCEKVCGDADTVKAAAKVCFDKLQRPRCQELVQNALNQQCSSEEERQKRSDNNTSMLDCKIEKASKCTISRS